MYTSIFRIKEGIMNKGGIPYSISNPPGSSSNWEGTPGKYSPDFEINSNDNIDHFDVYGEIQTIYSQVYWTRNNPINLPPEIVQRFKGKIMAIIGYEVDQVTHNGPQVGSTTTKNNLGGFSCYPDCDSNDKSIPIYHAYNHHYFAWLTGEDSEMYQLKDPLKMPNPTTTSFRTKSGVSHGYPTHIVFKENPGGEFRKSYHGYPKGYAQLLHSPKQWIVEPMQIDTHNRNYHLTDQVGYQPWFLPKTFQNNMTDHHNSLSPLIECPCTDRIQRSFVKSSSILISGECTKPITSEKECVKAILNTGVKVSSSVTINDKSKPRGCIAQPEKFLTNHITKRRKMKHLKKMSYQAIFNSAKTNVSCGDGEKSISLQGSVNLGNFAKITLGHNGIDATISITGPSSAWFGVAFDATLMKDEPYSIIIEGEGNVSERKLGNHAPGTVLKRSIRIISNTVKNGLRSVILHRRVKGISSDYYSFPNQPGDLNMIAALGSSKTFGYHKVHAGGQITLLPTETNSCVCIPTSKVSFSYMNTTTQFMKNYNCLDEPRSDMLRHGDGTGRDLPNNACNFETYNGGLECCHHTWLLTDKNQDKMIPKDKVDKYFLKWRYYFQEYIPRAEENLASHQHLHHWVFLIDAIVNDYEEDNAHYGSKSIGKITARLKAKEIGLEDIGDYDDEGAPLVPGNFTKITPIVMTSHCHAPSCIRQEIWNVDTNQILCNITAKYGDEKYGGSTDDVFNEKDYIAIPPCLFGFQPGLQFPFELSPDTNIKAIKYFNNTYRHLGQMAQWNGLMVYDTDPY